MTCPENATYINFWQALIAKPTIYRAVKISAIVGIILILINQFDLILAGYFPPVWKIILTFMVPYSVSSYSSAAFLMQVHKKNPGLPIEELTS